MSEETGVSEATNKSESDTDTKELLNKLQEPVETVAPEPQQQAGIKVGEAVAIGGMIASIAKVLAASLPPESRVGSTLQKLLDVRAELLAALQGRS
jgi:tetrahydromethanopterin S-methyltransferase subunit G